MNPKVTNVIPMEGYKLLLTFSNNEYGTFDVTPYLEDKFWASLRDVAVFTTVRVSGRSVKWENGVDFCPDELYENE